MKWPLGKKQTLLVTLFGSVLAVASYKLAGPDFANFLEWFVPAAAAAITVPAAAVSMTGRKNAE